MLNKLKFNNLVISNKKGIQQSRVQTINKLVHKIRKLKNLLEKHSDNTKCKERVRKSTESMEILKKIKIMDIMKKVLLLDKPAASIITNGTSTPEEIAISLLSMNKIMQNLIKRFKTELQLSRIENEEWNQFLMESSKRRQKIERTEEKRRIRLELKQKKLIGQKRQEWLAENEPNIEGDTDSIISKTGDERSNDNNICKPNEENNSLDNASKSQYREQIAQTTKKSKIKGKNKKESNVEKESNAIKEKNSNSDSLENECSDTEDIPESSLEVDPFFKTSTGENYLSAAIIRRENMAAKKNNEEKQDLNMIKPNDFDINSFDFRERHQQSHCKNQKYLTHNRHSENRQRNDWINKKKMHEPIQKNINNLHIRQDSFRQKKWENNSQNKHISNDINMKQDFQQQKFTNYTNKHVHPSWQAKQKLKPNLTAFQGKRIKFENDEDFAETNSNESKTIKASSSTTQKPISTEKDSIHPSWIAKQKLKPIISTFQGKKTIFDDNE